MKYAGSNEAKATIDRFTLARKAALDTFAPAVPPANILTAIAQAIGSVAATFMDPKTAITNLPDVLTASLTLSSLIGDDSDDNARNLINNAHAQGWLSRMPTAVKLQVINACLGGWTVDDDEIAINKVLNEAKGYNQAELYHLAASATWELLYSNIDGDEYDYLENILS